ncbi:MAG: branched-chain amino acid ABC transporter permease [Hyphomicrobiaceae bacterium]
MRLSPSFSTRNIINAALIAVLAVLPFYAWAHDNIFIVTLMTRVLVYAIATASLNFILGYGGMMSFGHAMFVGIGGYVAGIMAFHGEANGVLQIPLAMVVSGLVALVVGALSLRTRGVYFIMITLAFAQMLYFAAVGLEAYGADDGMSLASPTTIGPLDLGDKWQLYYVTLVVLLIVIALTWKAVNSRFGMVIRGANSNEGRMLALGFPVYPYRLTAFAIAGSVAGLAGVLTVNQSQFVSPAMMNWVQSGDLMVMVILGGMATLFGPLYGAIAFLVLEHVLSDLTKDWELIFGPFLVLLVLFARGGIDALIDRLPGGGQGGRNG